MSPDVSQCFIFRLKDVFRRKVLDEIEVIEVKAMSKLLSKMHVKPIGHRFQLSSSNLSICNNNSSMIKLKKKEDFYFLK